MLEESQLSACSIWQRNKNLYFCKESVIWKMVKLMIFDQSSEQWSLYILSPNHALWACHHASSWKMCTWICLHLNTKLSVKIYMVIGSDLINAKNFSTQSTILMLELDVWKRSHMSCQTVCITGNIYWLPARCVERTYLACENQKRARDLNWPAATDYI